MSLAMFSLNVQYFDYVGFVNANSEIMQASLKYGYSMSFNNAQDYINNHKAENY